MPACSSASGSLQNHFDAPLSSLIASANFLPAERLDATSFFDLEQRVTGERREELLAGEAGGPNDGDGNA